jgi:hypothetical protein
MADDRFVSEEAVFYAGLPVVARLLLPPAATDLLDSHDRAITSRGEGASSSRYGCCLDRRNDDVGAARSSSIVYRNRVISCVRRKTCYVVLDHINKIKASISLPTEGGAESEQRVLVAGQSPVRIWSRAP